ncbi:hypothetical protein FXO38_08515 [Capsicum annuum]|nr:hypothetical protein FXO38_08515 [Capsicum annuum]
MTHEVKDSSSGILICANGTFLNFTPREFAIITGLNCMSNRYDFTFDEGVPNRLVDKYLNGVEIIQKRQLFLAFTEKVWGENNDEDAEKFAILYFLHSFVLSNKGIDLQNHPRYKDKDSSNMFDVLFEDDLPQQPSGSLSLMDVYSMDHQNINAGGQQHHLNEYINGFRMHAAVPWDYGFFMVMYAEFLSYGHKVIPTEFDPKTLHTRYAALLWDYEIRKKKANATSDVEAPLRHARQSRITSVTEDFDHFDVCFYYLRKKSKYGPHKMCIFLYDSYESSGDYVAVLAEIEKIAKIIPLCLQGCDFYVKKGIDLQNHPRYKDKDSSNMFDVLFEDDLPQQPNGSLDCGVFTVMYTECLSYGHKVIPTEFDPNALRTRYATLYGTMEFEKNKQMQLVVFKNIESTKKKLAKLQIPQKDAIQHERSIDSDDDFQDPPSTKINEHSKKKQKVDSSTPAAKKPLRKKQVNIVDQYTQTKTPASRAAKSAGTKTPVFKPIPTRQASSSKMKKGKQTARVFLEVF